MNRTENNESLTVGRLAKRYGLSRSTLLYYDSLGLLRPQSRAAGDYRRYGAEERARLERILEYRDLGFSLERIARLLDAPANSCECSLLERLDGLAAEAAAISRKRAAIVTMLKALDTDGAQPMAGLDAATLVSALDSAGVDQEARRRFHAAFERSAPSAHRAFLEFIGMPPEEVAALLKKCATRT